MTIILILLALIIVANGAPIAARHVLGNRLNHPIDRGRLLSDGRPIFGPSKTWRGIFASIILTSISAAALGFTPMTGALISLTAMSGDLLSSFIKRRCGFRPSSMAIFLDQIPESLLPCLAVTGYLHLDPGQILAVTFLFFCCERLLSRLLYKPGIRKVPY